MISRWFASEAATSPDQTSETEFVGADTVVVTERAAALARDHCLHVADAGIKVALGHTRRFGQQRYTVRFQHHFVLV